MVCDVRRTEGKPGLTLVLILILLEYGLRLLSRLLSRRGQNVLILILLEYGLRRNINIICEVENVAS